MASQADLQAWTAASGRNWDQMCMAYVSNLMGAFGTLIYYPASALDGYYASRIESADAYTCPPGGVIWLDIGVYGHVMFRCDASNAQGTSRLQEVWGINAGLSDLAYYVSQTGARPLGWSWDSAGSTLPFFPAGQPAPAPTIGDDEMRLFWVGDSAYLQTPMGTSGALSGITYPLFWRLINSDQSRNPQTGGPAQETFTAAESQAMDEVLRSIVNASRG